MTAHMTISRSTEKEAVPSSAHPAKREQAEMAIRADDLHSFLELKHRPLLSEKNVLPAANQDSPNAPFAGEPLREHLAERQIEKLIRLERAKQAGSSPVRKRDLGWEILLDLTLAYLRKETVYCGTLRTTLQVDEATFWNAMAKLEQSDLITGKLAKFNPRKFLVELSYLGVHQMSRIIGAL